MITEWAVNYVAPKAEYNPPSLVFHSAGHKYFINGKEVPSATSINPYNVLYYKKVNKKILNLACKRGKAFHDFMEAMIIEKWSASKAEMSTATYDALVSSRKWLSDFLSGLTVIMAEQPLYDAENGLFAGTVDCIAADDVNKKIYIIDWKGSNAPTCSASAVIMKYRHQLDAYHYLFKTCFEVIAKDYDIEGLIVYLNGGSPQAWNVTSGSVKIQLPDKQWMIKRN